MFRQVTKEKMKPEMKKGTLPSGNSKGQFSFNGKNARGLPGNIRAGIESLSGLSMENVQVHYNSSKPAGLLAYAYTKGTEIHVAPGQEKHLPHEAWHVVQQMQGRVAPTGRIGGEAVNDSAALEREADVMGAKAVQAGSAEKLALQRKECGEKVSQLSHIVNVNPNTQAAPQLVQNRKPTIVFESMGTDEDSAKSVFAQTKQYSGNSICVFGLNKRVGSGRTPLTAVQIPDVYKHFFRGFTFQWTKPLQVNEGDQYKMPFIEARAEIMDQAEKIVSVLPKPSISPNPPETVPQEDYSQKFVYRWIDGDAKEDTSGKIPGRRLTSLADGVVGVLSGTYKWRSDSERKAHTHTFYHQFIDVVNECESRIREEYFKRKGKLAKDMDTTRSVPEYLTGRNGLNGYYIPETTLMMSHDSHTKILRNIRSRQAASEIYPVINHDRELLQVLTRYRNMELDNELQRCIGNVTEANTLESKNSLKEHIEGHYTEDRNGFGQESMQDKESMKVLKYAGVGRNCVFYEPKLVVSKPLKGDNGQDRINYLGDEMLQLFRNGTYVEEEEFYHILIKMRQSVFDKFTISEEESLGFRAFKEAETKKIYLCYLRLRQRISDELKLSENN